MQEGSCWVISFVKLVSECCDWHSDRTRDTEPFGLVDGKPIISFVLMIDFEECKLTCRSSGEAESQWGDNARI